LIFFRHADEIFERPINHVLCLCGNTPLLTSFEFNYLFFNVYDMKWMKRCIMYLDGRIFELILCFLLFLNEIFFFSPVGNGGALRFELKIIWLIFFNVFGNRFISNSAVGLGKKGRVRVCAVAAV
jgi:hypothetical protein